MKTVPLDLLKAVTVIDGETETMYLKGYHQHFPANSASWFVRWGLARYVERPTGTS